MNNNFIYSPGSGFAMPSSQDNIFLHHEINGIMSENQWNQLVEFFHQLILAKKILYILISILIIIGNTLVLLATCRERNLHQPNKYFIACLAVADLLVGIFLGPERVYLSSMDYESLRNISTHLCRFIVWIETLVLTASICSLIFVSFDRYLKISKPLQYRSRMTTSKSLKLIFITWLISFAFATYAATPNSGSRGFLSGFGVFCCVNYNETKRDAFYTFLSIILFLPAILMLLVYARIFVVAHQRQKMLQNGELGETSIGQKQRSVLRQDLKIVRMLLIVVGVFCLCWLPIGVYNLLLLYCPKFIYWSFSNVSRLYIIESLVRLLALSNSVCNPIIYACLDQTYREAFKNLFEKLKMCRTRSNTQQPPAAIELRPLRIN